MFSLGHVLIPLAIVKTRRQSGITSYIDSRSLYVFGIRLAYWTCDI